MAYRKTPAVTDRKAAARNLILEKARASVYAHGFSNSHMKDIARSAGVATGTLYNHFPSRDALFSEVFRQTANFELLQARKTANGEGAVIERLEKSLTEWCRRAIEWVRLAYALLQEPVDEAVAREREKFLNAYTVLFKDLIEEGIANGEFPQQDAERTAVSLIGVMAANTVWPLVQDTMQESEKTDMMTRAILVFCMSGIRQQGIAETRPMPRAMT